MAKLNKIHLYLFDKTILILKTLLPPASRPVMGIPKIRVKLVERLRSMMKAKIKIESDGVYPSEFRSRESLQSLPAPLIGQFECVNSFKI